MTDNFICCQCSSKNTPDNPLACWSNRRGDKMYLCKNCEYFHLRTAEEKAADNAEFARRQAEWEIANGLAGADLQEAFMAGELDFKYGEGT